MEPASRAPKPSEMAEEVVRRFGTAQRDIRAKMRACDDVPRFIRNVENAHRQTARSTLRFGPGPSQPPGEA